ncbi:hypothetical protein KKI93_17140 [Xenorhabdus bovienii]|uniref:hypothetical protein n=1 Tax=Xenorhabdus bovienii TaxID=40576 RepID=UPI0023B32FC5|nr:hypothetical protein [Xenorhabdus bovienii]MDE9565739.1 hypothetical protein [Xenorhabdus bovienii]
MPDPQLNEFFHKLENTYNPTGISVLSEYTDPINRNKTLVVAFENENVRNDLRQRARLANNRQTTTNNSLLGKLHQLGFEFDRGLTQLICSDIHTSSAFKLTNHAGYDITLSTYKSVILPSFSSEESSCLNRFKERMMEKKYQYIRERLKSYQSPTASPSRSPQPCSSSLNTQQRSSPPRSPVYTPVPVNIPRPHAPRLPSSPQTPLSPQRQVSPIRQYTSSEDLDFAVEVMRSHAKTPSPRR